MPLSLSIRVEITSLHPQDFNGTQLKQAGTVLTVFTADWCPFCIKFKPIFESAPDAEGMTKAIVDLTDLENPLWEVFDIRVVPTVVVFKDGESVMRKDGVLGRGLQADAMTEVIQRMEAANVT